MKKINCFSLFIFVAVLAGCSSLGQKEQTAQGLFDRYVATAYGESGLSSLPGITTSGTLVIESFGIEAPMTTKQMAPNYLIVDSELMGSKLSQGCRAETCWEQQPGQGPQLLQGDQLASMMQQADFFQWENMDKYYETLEIVSPADGTEASYHKVRAVRTNGKEDFYYFAKETGLLIGSELKMETSMGPMSVTNRLNNYERYGDVLLPSETVQETPMATVKILVNDVSFAPLSEADFPLPESL